MNITEMIKLLEDIKKKHGEAVVWEGCDRCDGGEMREWHIVQCIGGIPRLFLTHKCSG